MNKACAECGEGLSGRVDKKFCSDLCRNSFHNKQNSDETNYVRNVNNVLRKNRRILDNLLPNSETMSCSRSRLLELGFDFGFFTNTYVNKKGDTYFFCYEFGYLPLKNNYFCLVRKHQTA
jgi:hypothetical protein